MAFIGMESLDPKSLADVQKKQNNVEEYKGAFDKLHRLGILTFTGLMFALDEDTAAYYEQLPVLLDEVGTTVILPSIAIPLYGTPLYKKVVSEGRLEDTDLSLRGIILSSAQASHSGRDLDAYKTVVMGFYGWRNILRRWWRFMRKQERRESLPGFGFRLLISTFIYLKLSIFQRHHAQIRIAGADGRHEPSSAPKQHTQNLSARPGIPGGHRGSTLTGTHDSQDRPEAPPTVSGIPIEGYDLRTSIREVA
jgi:hypothetical protein